MKEEISANSEILKSYQEYLEVYKMNEKSLPLRKSIFPNNTISPLPKDLSKYAKINVPELQLDKIMQNSILYATIAEECFVMVSVHTLIQDELGNYANISFYCFPEITNRKDANKVLKKGLKIGVINPFYKSGNAGKEKFIRVDDLNTVTFINDKDTKKHINADEYKMEGNEYFKHNEFSKAIDSYSQAILLDPKNSILLSNRSFTYHKLKKFELALEDAEKAILLNGENDKLKFRKAAALCGLCKYYQAKEIIESIIKTNDSKDVRELLHEIEEKILQSEKGKYDFYDLYKNHANDFDLNVADYIGPIEIGKTLNMGRGIFATRDIQAGELLSLSKAFSVVLKDENTSDKSKIIEYVDSETNITYDPETASLINATIQKCSESLFAINLCHLLYDGSNEIPSINIKMLNPAYSRELIPNMKLSIDSAKIRRIISCNSFGAESVSPFNFKLKNGAGLWIVPSLYNHNCKPNAFRNCIGDIMIIRADRDIKKGEEIFVSYTPAEMTYKERCERLKFWKIDHCECDSCKIESKISYETQLKIQKSYEFIVNCLTNKKSELAEFSGQLAQNAKECLQNELNGLNYMPATVALFQFVFAVLKENLHYSPAEVMLEYEKALNEPALPNLSKLMCLTKLKKFSSPKQEFYLIFCIPKSIRKNVKD